MFMYLFMSICCVHTCVLCTYVCTCNCTDCIYVCIVILDNNIKVKDMHTCIVPNYTLYLFWNVSFQLRQKRGKDFVAMTRRDATSTAPVPASTQLGKQQLGAICRTPPPALTMASLPVPVVVVPVPAPRPRFCPQVMKNKSCARIYG